MKIGIDFGTSNSSVSIEEAGKSEIIQFEGSNTIPTALYVTRDGESYIGRTAVSRYIEENIGRSINLRQKYITDIEYTAATIGTITLPVYANIDVNQPGRLFTSLKTALRDSSFIATDLFGQKVCLEELIAKILREIKTQIERGIGSKIPEGVIFGRPVKYSEEEAKDKLAEERMREATEFAGFKNVRFVPEPIGALLSYQSTIKNPLNVLVFDFGGGTLDITIATIENVDSYELLAMSGVAVGGNDFDKEIISEDLFRFFGAGSTFKGMGEKILPFPRKLLKPLLDWYTLYTLNESFNMATLREVFSSSSNKEGVGALISLAKHNYGFNLHQEVERVKIALSASEESRIDFRREEIVVEKSITRDHFESITDHLIEKVKKCLDEAMLQSNLDRSEIDIVLQTGGSSLLPAVQEELVSQFGEEKLVRQDTFTQVARGLAFA